jgi:hypothetical protein
MIEFFKEGTTPVEYSSELKRITIKKQKKLPKETETRDTDFD